MIKVKEIIPKIKEAIEKKGDRKFSQSIDLSVSFKQMDFKNSANSIDDVIILPKGRGKKIKICALVDKELQTSAKSVCDNIIMADEFPEWQANPKKIKKLASECEFFIAQANVMPKVAKAFGKVLGPRHKMPSPKAGCIVAPNAKLEGVVERLNKTVLLRAKKAPVLNVIVGTEQMKIEDVAENIFSIIDFLVRHLPNKEQNIKHVYLKTTMGKSVKLM